MAVSDVPEPNVEAPSGAQAPESVRVPARVDAWMVVLAGVAAAGLAALVTPVATADTAPWPLRVAVVGMAFGTVGLLASVTIPVRYALDPYGVRVRSGWLRFHLAYDDLARADKVVGGLQGPSWSLVRVRLTLRSGARVEIAPRDRDAFLDALHERVGRGRRSADGWTASDGASDAASGA